MDSTWVFEDSIKLLSQSSFNSALQLAFGHEIINFLIALSKKPNPDTKFLSIEYQQRRAGDDTKHKAGFSSPFSLRLEKQRWSGMVRHANQHLLQELKLK